MMGDNEEGNDTDQTEDGQQPQVDEQQPQVDEQLAAVQEQPPHKTRKQKIRKRKHKAKTRRQSKASLPIQLNEKLNETFRYMSCANCQIFASRGRVCPHCCSLLCRPCIVFWFKKGKKRKCYECGHDFKPKEKFVKMNMLPKLGKHLKNLRECVTKEIFNLRAKLTMLRKQEERTGLRQDLVMEIGNGEQTEAVVIGNEQPNIVNNQQGPDADIDNFFPHFMGI